MIARPLDHAPDPASQAAAYPAVTRLDSLDLLRGLCALAVAVFHYRSWGGLTLPTAFDGFLAVCGTYGVSVFFILSGYSLAYAYGDRFGDTITADALLRYARRRAGRLIPLFSVITIASVAGKIVSGKDIPDIYTIAANLTLMFGFVDPANTPVIGGWSIGVEVVFYVLFPLLLLGRRRALAVIATTVFLGVWIDRDLSRSASLAEGWKLYVMPANQLVFFAVGTYAGILARTGGGQDREPRRYANFAGIVAILCLMFVLSYGHDDLAIVTGIRRLLLTLLAAALVIVVARIRLSGTMAMAASLAGGASYPLYLVHPLLFFLAVRILPADPVFYILLLGAAIMLAVLIDLAIDKPLQRRIKAMGW